nr:MAG TPA: hypothetical protein [Caudoviricetes sp.]
MQADGYTWAIVEGDNGMSVFNDIAVFFREAHYTAVLDAIGFSML